MARKAILTGGRKDEIINTALRLFFANGYEATSIRMIMDEVGGQIGMFYHYFPSKEALFDQAVRSFFENYRQRFKELITSIKSSEEFVDVFLPLFETSMSEFTKLQKNMHWTIQAALHEESIRSMVPAVTEKIAVWTENAADPAILSAQLIYGFSGLIHCQSFLEMNDEAKKEAMLTFIRKVLGL